LWSEATSFLDIADGIVTSAFGFTDSRAGEIQRYFSLKPNRWFLATYRDQPAGVVGATNYGPFTYLGMMTVHQEFQRRGIGQALLTDFPERGFAVYDASGDMTGYLFAQTQRLGPWAACSPQDAETLLQAALTLSYKGVPLVIAPGTNTAASDLFGRYGFCHVLTNRHMQRGFSTMPGRRAAVYGQTSFAIG